MPQNNADPENPPLTRQEVWGSGRKQILARIAAYKGKDPAQSAKLTPEQDIHAARGEILFGAFAT